MPAKRVSLSLDLQNLILETQARTDGIAKLVHELEKFTALSRRVRILKFAISPSLPKTPLSLRKKSDLFRGVSRAKPIALS